MLKRALLGLTFCVLALPAWAATVTLPSVTFTSPPSTSITCTPSGVSLVVPVPVNTIIFNCTVAPSGWSGAVTGTLNPPFVVSGLSGNTFNISLSAAQTTAGTVAPGSVSSAP